MAHFKKIVDVLNVSLGNFDCIFGQRAASFIFPLKSQSANTGIIGVYTNICNLWRCQDLKKHFRAHSELSSAEPNIS